MYIAAKKSCQHSFSHLKNARALSSSLSLLSKQNAPLTTSSMGFFSLNKSVEPRMMNARFFSNLPAHTKIEMPNLSPTMEKVCLQSYINH